MAHHPCKWRPSSSWQASNKLFVCTFQPFITKHGHITPTYGGRAQANERATHSLSALLNYSLVSMATSSLQVAAELKLARKQQTEPKRASEQQTEPKRASQ
jgi:hypothetical protein